MPGFLKNLGFSSTMALASKQMHQVTSINSIRSQPQPGLLDFQHLLQQVKNSMYIQTMVEE